MRNSSPTTLIAIIVVALLVVGGAVVGLNSCSPSVPTPDEKYLVDFDSQFAPKQLDLQQDNLALYVDWSTCNVLGQHSPVYNAILPSLTTATKNFYAIKGDSINLENDLPVFQKMRTIAEVNYADIKTAAERIASGNTEGVLLTDCEFFEKNISKAHINDPYLTKAFKTWLLRGHDIWFVIEPYVETNNGQTFNKKRFYIFFTDNRLSGNIWQRVKETANLDKFPQVDIFHLSADHPQILGEQPHFTPNDNLAAKVKGYGSFEAQQWTVDWKTVQNLVMNAATDAQGNPLKQGDFVCKGLKVDRNSLGGYAIDGVQAKVYNVNELYADYYDKRETGGKPAAKVDLSQYEVGGLALDADAFSRHGDLVLYFDPNFDEKAWLNGKPFNYEKVDIVVSKVRPLFDQYQDLFSFASLDQPGNINTSVAESVRQCLADPEVQQKAASCVLYTIYIQSSEK